MLEWIISSSLLILVVLALRAALGDRISARLRYGLWAVVLVRLLVPVAFFTLAVPVPGLGSWTPPETLRETDIYILPVESQPVESSSVKSGEDGTLMDPNSFGYARLEDNGQTITRYADRISPIELLYWIWAAGSVAMGTVLLSANLRFFRRLRRVRRPLEKRILPIPVYAAAGLPSPCLFGLLRPAVYVTEEAAAEPVMLRHVLSHELTHYRHLDHLWSILRGVALAIHWWNPLVWLAVIYSRRDGELACDEGTLKLLGDGERTAYGETLLSLVTARSKPGDLLCFATTMTSGKRSLRERIQRIARQPRQLVFAAAAAAAILSLSALCAFGHMEADGPNLPLSPPGAGWNDSIETVIEKLGITEEQIILNEKSEPVNLHDPEEWELYVQEFPFLGQEATVGFNFIHYDGAADGYGLNRVVVQFPEDADMAAVQAELIRKYGKGEAGRISSTAAFSTLLPDAQELQHDLESHHMYWEVGIEALPEDYMKRVTEWRTAHSSVSQEKIEGYLSETRPVNISWTDDFPRRTGLLTSNRVEFDATVLVEFLQNVPMDSSKPVNTKIGPYDVNRDGVQESTRHSSDSLTEKIALTQGDTVIWSKELDRSSGSWDVYFQCRVDGIDYLLEYSPRISTDGIYEYSYCLFHIESGKEVMDREDSIQFDVNFSSPDHRFDVDAIAAFMETVNGFIGQGGPLLNADLWTLHLTEKEDGGWYDDILAALHFSGENISDLRTALEMYAGSTLEILPYTPDLDRDGKPDTLTLRRADAGLTLWQLQFTSSGASAPAWTGEAGSPHVGWTSFYLCRQGGEDCLLQYSPWMGGGSCSYSYKLFYLTPDGEEVTVAENSLEFDLVFNPDYADEHHYDPYAIAGFMDEINALLERSILLVNTDENLQTTFEKEGRLYDSLWWLDGGNTRDEDLTLLDNLLNYANYAQDHPDAVWSPLADLVQNLTEGDIAGDSAADPALIQYLRAAERGSRFYTWDDLASAYDGHGVGERPSEQMQLHTADGSTLHLFANLESGSVLMILETSEQVYSAFYSSPELYAYITEQSVYYTDPVIEQR